MNSLIYEIYQFPSTYHNYNNLDILHLGKFTRFKNYQHIKSRNLQYIQLENLGEVAKSDLDKLERLAENFQRFHSHHETLKEEYESQYVAIKDRKL